MASVVLCAVSAPVATAGASTASPVASGGPAAAGISVPEAPAGLPGAAHGLARSAGPAAAIIDDALTSNSCAAQPDNPAIKGSCVAVGQFADGSVVEGLLETVTNGVWGGNTFGSLGIDTNPFEVSCVPQKADIPTCVAVGDFFKNPAFATQLVSIGGANGFTPVVSGNPKGDSWSVLDDVSCTVASFCVLVGEAGTSQKTSTGRVYFSHADAYRWNGTAMAKMGAPIPAHVRQTDLSAVSCTSAKFCMMMGTYLTAAGRTLPYSARLDNGVWRVQLPPVVAGEKDTFFQAISCTAPENCVAVGEAQRPGFKAFAERYLNGKWTMMKAVTGASSALFSVACPAPSFCLAAGQLGSKSLIEKWNGTRWIRQQVPATAKPFTVNSLSHVACVTTKLCSAVGYRHNPAGRFLNHTLGLGWNGTSWTLQKTIDE